MMAGYITNYESNHVCGRGLRVVLLILLYSLLLLVTSGVRADTVRLKRSTVVADTAEVVRLGDAAELSGGVVLGVSDLTIITTKELRQRGKFIITLDDIEQALASRRINLGRIAFSGEICQVHFASEGEMSRGRSKGGDVDDEVLKKEVVPGEWASAVIDDGTLRGQIARLITTQVHHRPAETVRLIFSERDGEKLALSALIHDFEIIPQGLWVRRCCLCKCVYLLVIDLCVLFGLVWEFVCNRKYSWHSDILLVVK